MESFDAVWVLVWLLTQGGAGLVAYWLMDKIEALKALDPEPKGYAALGLSASLGILAWLVLGLGGGQWLVVESQPVTAWEWINGIVSAGSTAVLASQVAHKRLDLRGQTRADRDN